MLATGWLLILALAGLTTLATGPIWAQDPAASRLWAEAQRLAEAGDPPAALTELDLLLERFAGDSIAPRATLESARLRLAIGDLEGARQSLQRLTQSYPQAPQAADGALLSAELRLGDSAARGTFEAVRTDLRRVALLFGPERHPRLAARQQALIRVAEIELLLGNTASAASAALQAIEDEPPSSWNRRGLLVLGRALLRQGEWLPAAQTLQQIIDSSPASEPSVGQPADGTLDQARQLLGLLHRRVLRPAAGQDPWGRVLRFPISGLELRSPAGIATGPNGQLLLLDDRQGVVALTSPQGAVLRNKSVRGADRPWFDAAGEPWLVLSDTLMQAATGARIQLTEPNSDRGAPLKGLAAAERGNFGDWFVLQKSARSLLRFVDRETPPEELFATSRPQLVDLAKDPSGKIYALDADGQQVLEVDLDGTTTATVASGDWKRPLALSVDELGYIFVLDRGNRRIDIYGPDGQPERSLGPQLAGGIELRNPTDLAVDRAGRLFISDSRIAELIVVD